MIPGCRSLGLDHHRLTTTVLPQSPKAFSNADLSKYDLQQKPSFLCLAPIYLEIRDAGSKIFRISRDTYIRCCRRDIHDSISKSQARSPSPERPICVDHPSYDVQQDPSSISFISCGSFPCEDIERLAAEESVCTFAGVDGGVEACKISSHLPT